VRIGQGELNDAGERTAAFDIRSPGHTVQPGDGMFNKLAHNSILCAAENTDSGKKHNPDHSAQLHVRSKVSVVWGISHAGNPVSESAEHRMVLPLSLIFGFFKRP